MSRSQDRNRQRHQMFLIFFIVYLSKPKYSQYLLYLDRHNYSILIKTFMDIYFSISLMKNHRL